MKPQVESCPIDLNHLTERFGLTSTEARVAAGLACGMSTAELALRFGVQPNTIRTHLKRALAKSGSRRQSELVVLLWRRAFEQLRMRSADAGAAEP